MIFDMVGMLLGGLLNTLVMTLAVSVSAYILGIPLGILLVIWAKDGLCPKPGAQKVLGIVIDLIRSAPFLILMLALQSLAGKKVIFVPLLVVSAPYVARIVESSLKEVDKGVIEAAKSMGASTSQIISMVLLPEAKPSLLSNAAIAVSTIFGYTAMAGFIGAEGLGAVALNYGYHHSLEKVLWAAVILLVIVVWAIQAAGLRIAKSSDRRNN